MSRQRARDVFDASWPKNFRIGAMILEVDVVCREPNNSEKSLAHVLIDIAQRINSARQP